MCRLATFQKHSCQYMRARAMPLLLFLRPPSSLLTSSSSSQIALTIAPHSTHLLLPSCELSTSDLRTSHLPPFPPSYSPLSLLHEAHFSTCQREHANLPPSSLLQCKHHNLDYMPRSTSPALLFQLPLHITAILHMTSHLQDSDDDDSFVRFYIQHHGCHPTQEADQLCVRNLKLARAESKDKRKDPHFQKQHEQWWSKFNGTDATNLLLKEQMRTTARFKTHKSNNSNKP